MTTRDVDYFSDEYGLTRTRSEVLHTTTMVSPGQALDLSRGNRRSSPYLVANGFTVTAWDKNPMSINSLKSIRAAETLKNLRTMVIDLNNPTFDGEHDLTPSTIVMISLEPDIIPSLTVNVQRYATAGGYNLIMATMDTEDYPCTVGFPFTFKPDGLHGYYQGWELLEYNEDISEPHRTDANSNRIKLCSATLLTCKPA